MLICHGNTRARAADVGQTGQPLQVCPTQMWFERQMHAQKKREGVEGVFGRARTGHCVQLCWRRLRDGIRLKKKDQTAVIRTEPELCRVVFACSVRQYIVHCRANDLWRSSASGKVSEAPISPYNRQKILARVRFQDVSRSQSHGHIIDI